MDGFGALHQGGTVVLQGKPEQLDPGDVCDRSSASSCNSLTIVGDAFARPLLDELGAARTTCRGSSSSAPAARILSPHMKEAFLELIPHVMIIDGFGASETGAQGSHATRAATRRRPASSR